MNYVNFNSIIEALSVPVSKFFWLFSSTELVDCGNRKSYYGRKIRDEQLTFDVSNNKVLANVNLREQ